MTKISGNLNILLVAPSNDASNVLAERLTEFFPPSQLQRILAYSRRVEDLPPKLRSYATDDLSTEEQVKKILSARIVVSTVNLAARFSYWGISRGHFDVLVVDEAGYATEPEVVSVAAGLMDFYPRDETTCGQMVLAGYPKQLGPVIMSSLCVKLGFGISYMERLTMLPVYSKTNEGAYPSSLLTMLVRNYRSHPALLKLPNKMFYNGELQACGDQMWTHSLAKWEHLPQKGFPVLFHAVEGENMQESNSPSWFNPQEAEQVMCYVHLLISNTKPPLKPEEIGIITPYARQAQKIRKLLARAEILNLKVGSVEMFQGQERRIIIVSTVRADPSKVSHDLRHNLGFVASPKRFNVTVTRAKCLLIVVGCARLLALDTEHWLPMLEYCHSNGSWCGEEWERDQSETEVVSDSDDDEVSVASVTEILPSQAVEQLAVSTEYHEV